MIENHPGPRKGQACGLSAFPDWVLWKHADFITLLAAGLKLSTSRPLRLFLFLLTWIEGRYRGAWPATIWGVTIVRMGCCPHHCCCDRKDWTQSWPVTRIATKESSLFYACVTKGQEYVIATVTIIVKATPLQIVVATYRAGAL